MMLKALDDKIMIAKQILLLSLDMINNGIVALLCHVLETGTVNDLTIKFIKKNSTKKGSFIEGWVILCYLRSQKHPNL